MSQVTVAFAGASNSALPHKATYAVDQTPISGLSEAQDLAAEFVTGYRGNTAAAYRRDLADFLGYSARAGLDPLAARRVDLNLYLRHGEDLGLAPATLARRLVALRGYYTYAVLEGHLAASPAEHVRYKVPRRERGPRALSLPELRALLAAADADRPRSAALVWLLATTGVRISEACNARHCDVQPGPLPQLRVIGKGRVPHLVPLVPPTWQRLSALPDGQPSGPLLATRTGAALDRRAAARTITRLATDAGIGQPVSPHALRHTFVTLARQTGCDLTDIQDAVGHADPATTRRYDHLALDPARHPAHALAGVLA